MLKKIKHRFTGAVLFSLECRAWKICVEAAVSSGAYLNGAYHVIHLGCPDGWKNAFSWLKDGTLIVEIGYRRKTMAEARAYWTGKYNRREVMAALDYAETVAKLRGWEITQ
jgi:hypothetical protein